MSGQEWGRRQGRGRESASLLELLRASKGGENSDNGLDTTIALVDQTIDTFIEDFIEHPFLHRVEHSVHAHLYSLLKKHEELGERVELGNGLGITQLVHKEWPETIAREGKGRGNFDLVVFTPQIMKQCASLEAYRKGHMSAPIVIEMGLDYDAEHLAKDVRKLCNSAPERGYLIHLVRELPRDPATEEIVCSVEQEFGLRSAYVWISGGQCVFKRLQDQDIQTSSF
jgi:hypothetical protein